MPDIKFSQLPDGSPALGSDILAASRDIGGGMYQSVRLTIDDLNNFIASPTWQVIYDANAGNQSFIQQNGDYFTIKDENGNDAYSFETHSNGDDNALRFNNPLGVNEIIMQNLNVVPVPRVIAYDSFASLNTLAQQIIYGRITEETLDVTLNSESGRYLFQLFERPAGALTSYFELNSQLKQIIGYKPMVLNDDLTALPGYQSYAKQVIVSASQDVDNTIIGKVAINNTANNVVLTILDSETFSINAEFEIIRTTTGTLTVQGEPGTSINGVPGGSISLPQPYDRAVIRKLASNDFTAIEYSSTLGNLSLELAYSSGVDGIINLTAGKHVGFTGTEAGVYDPVMTSIEIVSIPSPPTGMRAFSSNLLKTFINIGTPGSPSYQTYAYNSEITLGNAYDNGSTIDVSNGSGIEFLTAGQTRYLYSNFTDPAINNQVIASTDNYGLNDDIIPVFRRYASQVIRQRLNLTAPLLVDSSALESWVLENGIQTKYLECDAGTRSINAYRDFNVFDGNLTLQRQTSSIPDIRFFSDVTGTINQIAAQISSRSRTDTDVIKLANFMRMTNTNVTDGFFSQEVSFNAYSQGSVIEYMKFQGLIPTLLVKNTFRARNSISGGDIGTETTISSVVDQEIGKFSFSGYTASNTALVGYGFIGCESSAIADAGEQAGRLTLNVTTPLSSSRPGKWLEADGNTGIADFTYSVNFNQNPLLSAEFIAAPSNGVDAFPTALSILYSAKTEGTWTKVTGLSSINTRGDISFASDSVTINESGRYKVDLSVVFMINTNSERVSLFSVSVNQTDADKVLASLLPDVSSSESASSQWINVSSSKVLTLNSTDTLKIFYSQLDEAGVGTDDVSIALIKLNVYKV